MSNMLIDTFNAETIAMIDDFISMLIKNENISHQYAFEELYRRIYIMYNKNKVSAISFYYRSMSKLYTIDMPADSMIKTIKEIFMYVINKEKLK